MYIKLKNNDLETLTAFVAGYDFMSFIFTVEFNSSRHGFLKGEDMTYRFCFSVSLSLFSLSFFTVCLSVCLIFTQHIFPPHLVIYRLYPEA